MSSTDLSSVPQFHCLALGAGPANLSLAALNQRAGGERIALFDRMPSPEWHANLLHPGVRMQTSWLKDLVSVVDPTHPLSFLNYLVTEGRLFAMFNAQFDVIPRREYMRYLAWASAQLPDIHYGTDVDAISYRDHEFVFTANGEPIARGEHLVLGIGTRSQLPDWAEQMPLTTSFLADYLALHIDTMDPRDPVAVVGGGQTGIEAVLRLLNAGFTDIRWLGRRQWFMTIDDSPVANEFYRPAHQQFLQQLSPQSRRRLITEQNPTGDALTPGALKVLYQANYDRMLADGRFPVTLLPGRDVRHGRTDGEDVLLDAYTAEGREEYRVRHAIIAIGRETVPVPFDDELNERMDRDEHGELTMDNDYSVRWKGMNGNRIYALNRGRLQHGIPDANLTLLPVRSAIVLNSMYQRQLFTVKDELCPISWG